MNAYTELKADFDHLEKRAQQLFEYGMKREHILTQALVTAWKQFERICASSNIYHKKQLAIDAINYLSDVLSDQSKEATLEKPKKCCDFGTYECQVPMPLNGRRQDIDLCIADLVAALNAANIRTVGSCCGHGKTEQHLPGAKLTRNAGFQGKTRDYGNDYHQEGTERSCSPDTQHFVTEGSSNRLERSLSAA